MRALFDLLSRCPVLVIGGHALAVHGVARQTMDVDCIAAAEDRDAIDERLRGGCFTQVHQTENFTRYTHSSPMVPDVDLLLVDGPTFSKLQAGSIQSGGFRVPSLAHLIALKLHAIRNSPERELRDLADIQRLLEANPDKVSKEELAELCRRFGPPGVNLQ